MKAFDKKWRVSALAVLAAVWVFVYTASAQTKGTFTDKRDAKTYKTVTIGGKRWMAENLNYKTSSGSNCYDNNNSNCDKYGRLYNWNTAKTVCPAGYRLPSRLEWQSLVDYAGGDKKAAKKLKAGSGWKDSGNGTDEYGFSALPGGDRSSADDTFDDAGSYGSWWTATENGSEYAYSRSMGYSSVIAGEGYSSKSVGFSVRCVAD
ncbi:hypothetical protein R80B4_00323 [Fibrobacteres bacterium R8-0-B4]